MKKLWANIALATALATVISGCTIVDEPAPTPNAIVTNEQPVENYPAPTAAVDTRLVVTVLEGNGMGISTRQLSCVGSQAVSPTDLTDGDAACAVAETSSELFKTELAPTDSEKCTDTGNQVVADVLGESKGELVRNSFMRNNLCNAKIWDSLTPIIGLG